MLNSNGLVSNLYISSPIHYASAGRRFGDAVCLSGNAFGQMLDHWMCRGSLSWVMPQPSL